MTMPDFGRWGANGGDPSLNDINRTDRFLDSLAFEQPVYATDPGEAELANLLAGWRDEVRTPPLSVPVTPRDAVFALDRASASRKRSRTLAVVGSAAAAVLCLGGFVSVVAGAGPGDSLYGLHTMIFGEQQKTSDTAVMLASQQLAEVQQLVDDGQWQAAQDKLQTLTTTVATVNDVEQKQDLVTQWQELTVKVEQQDPAATVPPGAPPPVFPDVPVVVAPGTDTSTTTTSSETTSSETTTSPSDTTTSSPASTTTTSPSEATTTTPPSETTTSAPGTTSSPPPSSSAQKPPPTTSVSAPPPNTQTALQTAPPSTPPPSAPLPTPSAVAPLPTPSAVAPLPTPSAVAPLPTPTTRLAAPTAVPAPPAAVQEEPPAVQAPKEPSTVQAPKAPSTVQAPKSEVTTTVVVPEPGGGPG